MYQQKTSLALVFVLSGHDLSLKKYLKFFVEISGTSTEATEMNAF